MPEALRSSQLTVDIKTSLPLDFKAFMMNGHLLVRRGRQTEVKFIGNSACNYKIYHKGFVSWRLVFCARVAMIGFIYYCFYLFIGGNHRYKFGPADIPNFTRSPSDLRTRRKNYPSCCFCCCSIQIACVANVHDTDFTIVISIHNPISPTTSGEGLV